MADSNNAVRDGNHIDSALGVSTADATLTLPLKVDPVTGGLIVKIVT